MKLRFWKSKENTWYYDYPGWIGPQAALAMIEGADDLLDALSNNGTECIVQITNHNPDIKLALIEKEYMGVGGATYNIIAYQPNLTHMHGKTVWLCPVTLFVFGEYPESIELKLISFK